MTKKIKGSKTMQPSNRCQQGKLRWIIELKNGDIMDKYNEDGTKNVYANKVAGKVKVHVPIKEVKTVGLKDEKGNVLAVMDVPDGAVVFQRRRVRDINYYNRFHTATQTVGGKLVGGRWVPERILSKQVPEYTYGECWLIGWRTSSEVRYKCVYPDGKTEEYNAWDVKPWLYEPQWFSDEQV